MSTFLTFLLNNKCLVANIVLLLALASSCAYIAIERANIKTLEAQQETINLKLQISENSNTTLKTAIDTQNKYIEDLKKDAENRLNASKAELNRAKTLADKYKKEAEELMKKRPPPDTPICKAAEDLINAEIRK